MYTARPYHTTLPANAVAAPSAPTPTAIAEVTATPALSERKRSRVACLEEPLTRTVYELVVSQLYHDGYTDAADAVASSTGCLVADLASRGRRLERLVANGLAVEATHAADLRTFFAAEVVEKHMSRAALRMPVHMQAAQLKSVYAIGQMRERFVSSSLGGVIRACTFSPDGSYVLVGGGNKLGARLFSLTTLLGNMNTSDTRTNNTLLNITEEPLSTPQHQHATGAINANTATSLSEARYFTKHRLSVEAVAFHPSEPFALTGGREGELYMWSYRNPTGVDHPKAILQDTFPIRALDVSPSGDYAVIATDHSSIRLANLEGGQLLTPAGSVHTAALSDVKYRSDGRTFVTASFDGSIALHDLVSGKTVLQIAKAHSGLPTTSARYSRSGDVVLSYGMDATARLWDLRRVTKASSSTSGTTSSSFANGSVMQTVTPMMQSGTNALGDAPPQTSICAQSFGTPAKCEHRIKAAFNANESLVLTQDSSLCAVQAFDVYSGEVVYSCAVAQHAQRAFAVGPLSPMLVTGGDDCRLRLWCLSTLP